MIKHIETLQEELKKLEELNDLVRSKTLASHRILEEAVDEGVKLNTTITRIKIVLQHIESQILEGEIND